MPGLRLRLVVVTVILIALPSLAHAQRRGRLRGGPVISPYGPVYNPVMSPEYRLWVSNPAAYEQLMMYRQQQMMMKQQQAYMKEMKRERQVFDKWVKTQKARKDKGLPTDPDYDQYLRMQAASGPGFLPNANADPTLAPGGGPRPPATRKAAAKKAAPKKAASKKAAKTSVAKEAAAKKTDE